MLILRLCVILLVLVPVSAPSISYANHAIGHDGVTEINEFTSLTRSGWAHNARHTIDNTTNTPAGGGALRGYCDAGWYSGSCGRSDYTFPVSPTEIYVGHWIKWSDPFDWNPQGTKFDYLVTRNTFVGTAQTGTENFMLMVGPNGQSIVFTQQLYMKCADGPCTKSFSNNIAAVNMIKGKWYWFEYHAKMNTLSTYGNPDGLIEFWMDDKLVLRHANVTLRNSNTPWGYLQHSNEWGGAAATINQIQYIWNDHTVVSSARIGMPGGVQIPGDTQAPTAPSSLVAQ